MRRFAHRFFPRRLLALGLLLLLPTVTLGAQRRPAVPDAATRAAIDSFVITVRDMAAWALVTPAAHVPVGALQDLQGNVESVVGSQGPRMLLSPDSVLAPFRQAMESGARERRPTAVGLGYFRALTPPGGSAVDTVLVVEVAHVSGHRATIAFPFRMIDEQPQFLAPFALPAQLRAYDEGAGRKRRPVSFRRAPLHTSADDVIPRSNRLRRRDPAERDAR